MLVTFLVLKFRIWQMALCLANGSSLLISFENQVWSPLRRLWHPCLSNLSFILMILLYILTQPNMSLDGKLNFRTHTRPDLSFAVQVLNQNMQQPTELHFQALRHTLNYVASTSGQGILSHGSDALHLHAYIYSCFPSVNYYHLFILIKSRCLIVLNGHLLSKPWAFILLLILLLNVKRHPSSFCPYYCILSLNHNYQQIIWNLELKKKNSASLIKVERKYK